MVVLVDGECLWTVHTPAGYVIEGNTRDYVVRFSKPKRRSGLMV